MNKLFEQTFQRGIYEFGYLKGNLWLKVFFHSYKNKALFSGPDEAKYTISEDKYSIFVNITDDFKINNKFEFIIYYPEDNVYFRWVQNNNPINELENSSTKASGFEDKGSTVEGYKWGGLVKTNFTEKNEINSLLNGNPGHNHWYFAIGMYDIVYERWKNSGIPSYLYEKAVNYVYVWLRLFRIFNSFYHNKSLFIINIHISLFTSIIINS